MKEKSLFTNGGENGGGKIEGAGKFPLYSGFVWNRFDDNSGQDSKIVLANVVFAFEHIFKRLQCYLLFVFVFRFECIKDRRSDQQVRERANDQR